jgi:pyruvate dehydrogenase E2 component (dihydrolipoamide acetyltransferase)
MAEFRMPSLGADMDAGTLMLWRVKPGDRVKRGDIIADVETAKGVIEIEIFEDGLVDQIITQPGMKVPVGEVIAVICGEGEMPMPVIPKPAIVEGTLAVKEVAVPVKAAPAPATEMAGERARISPLARKVASDLGVDLAKVVGTGPGGVITRADIERAAKTPHPAQAAEAAAPAAPPVTPAGPALAAVPIQAAQPVVEKAPLPATSPAPEPKRSSADFQTAMRQAIAAAMSRSNRDIPHYYLETRIDMTRALRWLETENQKRTIVDRLLPVVLLVKASAKALCDVPELNGYWVDNMHQPAEAIHIGFAVALRQGGLVTPAIHNADMKSLDELREAIADLIMRTRAGRLRSSELTDATITLTSLGDRGVEKVYGVIYPPQVALVGFGKISDQPWAENGLLGVRPVMVATLAGDHRATDGHRGSLFLDALNRYLQEVEKL